MWRRDRDVQAGVFLPEAPDVTMEEFIDYENQHSRLSNGGAFAVHPERGTCGAI
jgi:hypothetical protein